MALLARQSRKARGVGRLAASTPAGARAASVVAPHSLTRLGWGSRRAHLMRREEAHHQLAT